jgi:hypothetical protein
MSKEHYITGGDSKAKIQGLTVRTIADRDSIPAGRRRWKMIVGVYDDGEANGFYALEFGLSSELLGDNGNWERGTLHARAHSVVNQADHLPATGTDKGKYVKANAITGEIEYSEIKDYETIPAPLIGIIDGTNTIFSTPTAYKSGSISVFRNGLKEKYFNELSDTQIEFHTAPSNIEFIDTLETIYTKKQI